MPISTKKFVNDGKTYKIKHHPATEGCELIENYATAISAFILIMREGTYSLRHRGLFPFSATINCQLLALLMFMGRVANNSAPFQVYEPPSFVPVGKELTVREVLAGKTLEDREEVQEIAETRIQAPASYAIDYKATDKQEAATDYEAVFGEFFKYITLDDKPLDITTLTMTEITQMLYAFVEHNVAPVWGVVRFSLPENYDSGGIAPPRSMERSAAGFSQPHIIYSI